MEGKFYYELIEIVNIENVENAKQVFNKRDDLYKESDGKRKSELKDLSKIFEKNKKKYSEHIKDELRLLLNEKELARWSNEEWKQNIKMITSRLEDYKISGTKEERKKALNEALILMKKADDVQLSKKVRGNKEVKLYNLKKKYGITFKDIEEQ